VARQRIEPESHVPIYLQIVEYLRSAIAAGVFRPGEALPSLRALAIELKVNPNTVQRAYDEMDRQGIVRSRRGVGIFVAERGARWARGRAEESVHAAFAHTIGMAKSANLSTQRIQDLFDEAMNQIGPIMEQRS